MCINLHEYMMIYESIWPLNMVIDRYILDHISPLFETDTIKFSASPEDKFLVSSISPPKKKNLQSIGDREVFSGRLRAACQGCVSFRNILTHTSNVDTSELVILYASCDISRHPGTLSSASRPSHCSQNLRCSS